jgi:hypothetical protein
VVRTSRFERAVPINSILVSVVTTPIFVFCYFEENKDKIFLIFQEIVFVVSVVSNTRPLFYIFFIFYSV